MELRYKSVIFELVYNNEKKLCYGHFEPFQFYSFSYHKENMLIKGRINRWTKFEITDENKEEIIIQYIKLILSSIEKSFDSINVISMLDKPIKDKYLSHFQFILDQKLNPEIKLVYTEPEFILFDDSDYGSNEEEYLCDLRKYNSDPEFEFVTECICDLYCLPKDFDKAKEKLNKKLQETKEEIENGGPETNEYYTEEDKNDYLNLVPNAIVWIKKRIDELEKFKPYDEEFVNNKRENCEKKIKFYNYLKNNNLADKKECMIKIVNQLLRKEKLTNPEKLRYNLVIKDYTYNKERDGIKRLEIKFFNEIKDIEGVYNLEKKGYYGSYGYYSKETLEFETKYDQEVILDQEYLKEVFQGDIFYELVGHSSGVDPDEPGYYDE